MPTANAALAFRMLQRQHRALKMRVAELERLVVCDTLTPLFNRRHFMDELARWCERKHRYDRESALLFIDVDNLKVVNDGYGHMAGDAVLIAIAKALLASVRHSDFVARIGGDEFAILLDHIPSQQITSKAVLLTNAISALEIAYQGLCLRPEISVDFTPLESGAKPIELLLRADRSMYAIKHATERGSICQAVCIHTD